MIKRFQPFCSGISLKNAGNKLRHHTLELTDKIQRGRPDLFQGRFDRIAA